MLIGRFVQPAINTARRTVLQVAGSKVRLYAGHASARDIVLVVVVSGVVATSLLLVVLVVLVMVLVMLEGLAKIHLHGIGLLPCPPVHHDIVGLMSMALVEHAELLRR